MVRSSSDMRMRVTYDPRTNAAYMAFRHIEVGEPVGDVVVERPSKGDIILDLNQAMLGVRSQEPLDLAPAKLLAVAERL
jgi:hypothetical protein